MLKDRYDNPVSTSSTAARDAYIRGVDLLIGADAGVEAALQEAVTHDEGFAMAHLAMARALQSFGRPKEAAAALARARDVAGGITEREASAIEALAPLIEGKGLVAYPKIRAHVAEHPRDVVLAQTCTSVFGLIGFSGLAGREAEQLAYTSLLAPHYGDDWWFLCQHAFAQLEVGQLEPARRNIDRSLELKPDAAHVVHVKVHWLYESAEMKAGYDYIKAYKAGLDRTAQLHCHVAWHVGLWALESGDLDTMWKVVDEDIAPGASSSPAINILTDSVALLARAQLRGVDIPNARWKTLSDFAAKCFPVPGIAFADVHAALAHAMAGNGEALEKIIRDAKGPAADIVSSLADTFGAYAKGEWANAVNGFVGVMCEHERIGGSLAQRDLIEYALTGALIRLGHAEEAARLLAMRRPRTSNAQSVEGLPG